jgi:hypothetical protein
MDGELDARGRGLPVGNEQRRQQYVSGVLCPRETILLGSPAEILTWAHRHLAIADNVGDRAGCPAPMDCRRACPGPRSPLAERQMDADRWPAPAVLSAAAL